MRKSFAVIFFLSAILFMTFQSCSRKPFACFRTDIDEDSIRVNQTIIFNSVCSSSASSYYWEFYDNEDSIFFTSTVQKIFYDTGTVKVFLLVTNGNKSSSTSREIHVMP